MAEKWWDAVPAFWMMDEGAKCTLLLFLVAVVTCSFIAGYAVGRRTGRKR